MKKLLAIICLAFLAFGLAVFAFDAYTSWRYGFHMNEVAGVTDDGDPIDWPTGERPAFTLIPLFVYGLGFWLAGAGVYSIRSCVGRGYRGRICRGTE
jgi:hypothetical protein